MKNNSLYSILIALVVSLGGFLLGFDGAVISGAIPFYKISLGLNDNPFLLGLSVSSIVGGSILGNFISGIVSDKIGRKPTLIITSLLFIFGSAGTALASDITIFIAARIIGGLGVGMAILVAPMYIAEIAPPKQRGKLVTFNQLNIVLGLSSAYFSNYFILQSIENPDDNWRWMLGMGLLPAFIYFLLLLLVPESPRWMIQNGKDAKGKAILEKAGGMAHAVNEYNNIKKSIELSLKQPKASFGELLSGKIKVAMIIGLALAFFQQISGINAVLYYAPMVFETAGGGRDAAFLQSVILGFVFIGGTVISMFLIDKLGRKPLLIIGSSLMALSLLITGIAFNNARYSLDQRKIELICKALYEKAILNEAMVSNPNNYSTDSIQLGNRKAFLYKGGNIIAEVDLNKATIVSIGKEIDLLKEALLRFKGVVYSNETEFFSSIKNELSSLVAINIKNSSLKAQDPFYELMHSKTSKAFSFEEIAGMKLAEYKPLILSDAIEINSKMVLIGILGFIFGFSISLGPVMWAMLAEIFPNKLRGIAISLAGTFNAITSFFVASIFPAELDYLGSAITYYIFAGFMVLCLFFVWKYVYETKGKTLEELESDLISEGGIKEVYYAH